MDCHQILSGACNVGDKCFAIGSVEGINFTVSNFCVFRFSTPLGLCCHISVSVGRHFSSMIRFLMIPSGHCPYKWMQCAYMRDEEIQVKMTDNFFIRPNHNKQPNIITNAFSIRCWLFLIVSCACDDNSSNASIRRICVDCVFSSEFFLRFVSVPKLILSKVAMFCDFNAHTLRNVESTYNTINNIVIEINRDSDNERNKYWRCVWVCVCVYYMLWMKYDMVICVCVTFGRLYVAKVFSFFVFWMRYTCLGFLYKIVWAWRRFKTVFYSMNALSA